MISGTLLLLLSISPWKAPTFHVQYQCSQTQAKNAVKVYLFVPAEVTTFELSVVSKYVFIFNTRGWTKSK
jgi:hypothetical protein